MPETVHTQQVAHRVYSRDCRRAIQVPTFSSRQPREKADRRLKCRLMRRMEAPRQFADTPLQRRVRRHEGVEVAGAKKSRLRAGNGAAGA